MLTPKHPLVVQRCWQAFRVGRTVLQNLRGWTQRWQFKGFRFTVPNKEKEHEDGNDQRKNTDGHPTHGLGGCFWAERGRGEGSTFLRGEVKGWKANQVEGFNGGDLLLGGHLQDDEVSAGWKVGTVEHRGVCALDHLALDAPHHGQPVQ